MAMPQTITETRHPFADGQFKRMLINGEWVRAASGKTEGDLSAEKVMSTNSTSGRVARIWRRSSDKPIIQAVGRKAVLKPGHFFGCGFPLRRYAEGILEPLACALGNCWIKLFAAGFLWHFAIGPPASQDVADRFWRWRLAGVEPEDPGHAAHGSVLLAPLYGDAVHSCRSASGFFISAMPSRAARAAERSATVPLIVSRPRSIAAQYARARSSAASDPV